MSGQGMTEGWTDGAHRPSPPLGIWAVVSSNLRSYGGGANSIILSVHFSQPAVIQRSSSGQKGKD